MTETCPTFLVRGEQIVEVYYTDWVESAPGQWSLGGDKRFEITGDADTLIVELPIGCYELSIGPVIEGDSLTLQPGSGHGPGIYPQRCQRPRQFLSEAENTLTTT